MIRFRIFFSSNLNPFLSLPLSVLSGISLPSSNTSSSSVARSHISQLLSNISCLTVSEEIRFLFLVIMLLETENILSIVADVAGIARYRLAKIAIVGNLVLFWPHYSNGSTYIYISYRVCKQAINN